MEVNEETNGHLHVALPNSISDAEEDIRGNRTDHNYLDTALRSLFFCTPKTSTAADNSYDEVEQSVLEKTSDIANSKYIDSVRDSPLKSFPAATNCKRLLAIAYENNDDYTDSANEILLMSDILLSSPLPPNTKPSTDVTIIEPTIEFNPDASVNLISLRDKQISSQINSATVDNLEGSETVNSATFVPITSTDTTTADVFAAECGDPTTTSLIEGAFSTNASESLEMFGRSAGLSNMQTTDKTSASELSEMSLPSSVTGDNKSPLTSSDSRQNGTDLPSVPIRVKIATPGEISEGSGRTSMKPMSNKYIELSVSPILKPPQKTPIKRMNANRSPSQLRKQLSALVTQEWLMEKGRLDQERRCRQKCIDKHNAEIQKKREEEAERARKEAFDNWLQKKVNQRNYQKDLKATTEEEEERKKLMESRCPKNSQEAFRQWIQKKNREAREIREGHRQFIVTRIIRRSSSSASSINHSGFRAILPPGSPFHGGDF